MDGAIQKSFLWYALSAVIRMAEGEDEARARIAAAPEVVMGTTNACAAARHATTVKLNNSFEIMMMVLPSCAKGYAEVHSTQCSARVASDHAHVRQQGGMAMNNGLYLLTSKS